MMKKIVMALLMSCLFILTSCGITEELDQAKSNVAELKIALKTQSEHFKEMGSRITRINDALESDLNEKPQTGLFPDEEGLVFENYQYRLTLEDKITDQQKSIITLKKNLEKIIKQNAADVNNDELKLISDSLDIIDNNYKSLKNYCDTTFNKEEEFYSDLPEKLDSKLALLERNYGAIYLVTDEGQANIKYTTDLITTFEKNAKKSKVTSDDN